MFSHGSGVPRIVNVLPLAQCHASASATALDHGQKAEKASPVWVVSFHLSTIE